MQLTDEDRKYCLRHLPKRVIATMKEAGPRLVLAGGLIRSVIASERINDIDLFVSSKEDARLWIDKIADKSKVYETQNAYSVRSGRMFVQIIHRWTYANPADIVPSFDFTVARAAIWHNGSQWTSLCDDRFYIDLAAKRLVYRSPVRNEDAGGSMLRILKFYQRGYRIPLDSFGGVMARLVSGVDLEKIADGKLEREEQLAKVFTGLLREVDPNIDPEHEAHLPTMASEATSIESSEHEPV